MGKNTHLLHASIAGHGPTIVLLHGFLSSAQYWRPLIKLLEKTHRIVALDLLGFGDSPKPSRTKYNYRDHVGSVKATLKHLGIKEPFTLVGHSMGSLIGLRYAVLYPQEVNKLVLVNPPVMLGAKQVMDEVGATGRLYRIALHPLIYRIFWPVLRLLHAVGLLPADLRRRLHGHQDVLKHNAASRLRSFHRIIRDAQTDRDLQNVRVPTLLLSGLEDRKIYLDNLHKHIVFSPAVRVETVPTGHHIPHTKTKLLAEKLLG